MTAKTKRAPEFTFQPILLEFLVQLAAYRPMEKILIKITILHLYDMDAIYEDKN